MGVQLVQAQQPRLRLSHELLLCLISAFQMVFTFLLLPEEVELLSCAKKVCRQLCRLPVKLPVCWLCSFSPAFAYVQKVPVNFVVHFNIQ